MKVSWRAVAAGAIIVALCGATACLLICRRKPVVHIQPVTPTTAKETAYVVTITRDTFVKLVQDRAEIVRLNGVITRLTEDRDNWSSWAQQLSQQLVEVDSAWAARFDSISGIVSVQYARGRLTVVQFERPKYVRTSTVSAWRNTWVLKALPGGGLKLQTRRLPVDIGYYVGADWRTPYDSLAADVVARAGLTASRQGWVYSLGGVVGLEGKPRLNAAIEYRGGF